MEHMGAVPYRMVFDNLSAAVVQMGKGHERILSEPFSRFMTHYGIEAFVILFLDGKRECRKQSRL